MTRFQMEISGQLGDYWKKNAEKDVERLVKQAKEEATVEEDGAIRWNRSNNYLPDDCCEKLEYAGFDFSREATAVKREAQNKEFFEQYKAMKHEPTEEEMDEMRATFGAGTKVVDILSGREYQL